MADSSILFADLAGFTALTEAHGDAAATDLLDRFYQLATTALSGGARLVKTIGDAVMVTAPTADAIIQTAVRLLDATSNEPTWPALRVGVHCGPLLERGGDCFGATVNVAARVTSHARAGQILCTRSVVRAVAASGHAFRHAFRPLGEVHFRNVHDAVEVFELVDDTSSALGEVDPVCRMRVDPATAPARLPYLGRTFSFCSFRCAQAFAAEPSTFFTPPAKP